MRARPILALVVLAALVSPRGYAARGEVYALVGGRVFPVSGPVIEKGTVVIRDGLIEAVGAGVVAPVGARVIDVKGLTVTPGIVDGFGGIGLPAPRPGGSGRGAPRPALECPSPPCPAARPATPPGEGRGG